MRKNVQEYILPHFDKLSSREALVDALEKRSAIHPNVQHLVAFAELGYKEKAKNEYQSLVANTRNPGFLQTLKEHSLKYGLD
jgi:hypothetical protein